MTKPPGRAPRLVVEKSLHGQGFGVVAGVDEVGRGCLSGPVTVGVVLPAGHINAAVTVALAGAGGLLLYVMFAKAFRVQELADLTESVTHRFRR